MSSIKRYLKAEDVNSRIRGCASENRPPEKFSPFLPFPSACGEGAGEQSLPPLPSVVFRLPAWCFFGLKIFTLFRLNWSKKHMVNTWLLTVSATMLPDELLVLTAIGAGEANTPAAMARVTSFRIRAKITSASFSPGILSGKVKSRKRYKNINRKLLKMF